MCIVANVAWIIKKISKKKKYISITFAFTENLCGCKWTYWGIFFLVGTLNMAPFFSNHCGHAFRRDRTLSSRRRGSITDSHCIQLSASSQLTGAALVTAVPVQELFSLKPQLDLSLSPLQWITGMDHIPLNDQHTSLFYLQDSNIWKVVAVS